MPFIELLRWPIFWLAVATIMLAQILLLISALRMRRPAGQPASPRVRATNTELNWTLIAALGLGVLLAFIYRALADI